jgi:O-antigen ligase
MKGLLLTYAVVFSGALIALRKPAIGLYIYVALCVLRPEALWGWAGDLSGMSDTIAYPLLVGWMFQGFGSWSFGRGRAIVVCLLLYTLWAVLSMAQAIDSWLAWNHIVEFLKTLLPFLVGVTMLKTEKEMRALLWVIVLCQAYVCFDMNRTYLEGYNRVSIEGFGGLDNNSFGISLVTTVGAALGLFLAAQRGWMKVMFGLATLLIMHTVLLTFSRGAFVGLMCAGVMALVILPKRPKYIGAVLLTAAIGAYFTGPELKERFGTTFAAEDERDGSAESRLRLWADMGTVISERPIFGVGSFNWPLIAERFGWPRGKEGHSLWVQTAAENGVPGVSFLLLFYGLTIVKLWPIARRRYPDIDEPTAMIATGIILAIVGFAASAQFVSVKGLEPPYYLAMIGVVLLKLRAVAVPASVPATIAARRPVGVLGPRAPVGKSS